MAFAFNFIFENEHHSAIALSLAIAATGCLDKRIYAGKLPIHDGKIDIDASLHELSRNNNAAFSVLET